MAARYAREAYKGGPDYFGEETTLKQLERHLLDKGVSPDEVYRQLADLTVADFFKPVPVVGAELSAEVRRLDQEDPLHENTPMEAALSEDESYEDLGRPQAGDEVQEDQHEELPAAVGPPAALGSDSDLGAVELEEVDAATSPVPPADLALLQGGAATKSPTVGTTTRGADGEGDKDNFSEAPALQHEGQGQAVRLRRLDFQEGAAPEASFHWSKLPSARRSL